MDCRILAQKLKDARTRRCHMIFDGFSPDQDDQIHLDGIDEHLGYLHPDSAACLAVFFQSFYIQTQRDKMNRKYFTANMLAALERNKFNLQTLFQDPDILELERRLLLIQKQYLASNIVEGESDSIYETNQILSPKDQADQTEVREFILEEQKEPQSENLKKSGIESQSTAPDTNALSPENLLSFYTSQKQNYKKLQTYMKRHFGVESDLQKSINYSRDIDFAEKDNLSVSLILKDQHNDKATWNNSHRHSVPFLEEITAGYHQHAKDCKSKGGYTKGANLDTFPETIQNTESDPLSSLSLRTLRGISLEALANMNSLNLGSLRGSYMQEKLTKPLFSEQNCHHYTGKQAYQQITGSAKRQSVIDTHKDSIVSMPVTNNTPKFSKVLEKSSKIINKKGSFSDNKAPQTSYTASSKSNLTSIQSSRRSSQINHKETVELPVSSVSERPSTSSKRVGYVTRETNRSENKQKDIRKPTTTPTKPVVSTSFSKSDKKASSIYEQQRKSIQDRRLSYNPVLEVPVRRDGSNSGVKNGANNGSNAAGNRYNKENNYNFSFTEREILEGQTC